MEFEAFADRCRRLETESGDLATTAAVADLFGDAGDDLAVTTRFLLGRVFPAHDTRTLDIGPAACHEAIARAAGPNVSAGDVEDRLADRGEIGAVAAGFEFGGQQGLAAFAGGRDALSLSEVDRSLRELAAAEGAGSESRKVDALFGLFNRCEPAEAKLLARLVLGEMRIGVGEGTVRDAVAEAFLVDDGVTAGEADGRDTIGDDVEADGVEADDVEADDAEADGVEADDTEMGDAETDSADRIGESDTTDGDGENGPVLHASDEAVAAVARALQVTNDYGHVAVLARERGIAGLREERLAVGRPVQAMLAQAGTARDAVESFGEVAVETKFDGARVQVHYVPEGWASTGDARETRTTEAAGSEGFGPRLYSRNMDDVTDALPEIVEYVEARVGVPTILDGEVIAVDDDGDPLPFQEVLRRFRRKHDVERMREAVTCRLHAFDCLHADGDDLLDRPLRARHQRLVDVCPDAAADLRLADEVDAVEAFERDALEAGHEGVMLKDPDAAYTPGDRGREWLKRKPDVETLDAVVVGAEWGEGRRAELFGTFLLAVRKEGSDDYATIGKVATGLSDAELEALTARLEPHVTAESGTDVSLRPEVVIEVGYEAIQSSPTYNSGYALRFPRFVGVREDKSVTDADTLERIRRLAGS